MTTLAPLRIDDTDHYAIKAYRGKQLVAFAVRNAWDEWHIPTQPQLRKAAGVSWRLDRLGIRHQVAEYQTAWRSVGSRAEAVAALAGAA